MPNYKEALFPLTYRADQVQEIMDAIARLRSIAVYGLAGMGKSNVFRFLVAHPDAKRHYLGKQAPRFIFAFVDCNLIDPRSTDALLDEMDEQLARAGLPLPDAPASPRAHPLRRLIQRRIERLDPGRVVVILLDPLDQTFRLLDSHFWAYLRGLRDLHGNVVFVLGARTPPPPLVELQELLTRACWVTPLTRQDALDSLARDGKRLAAPFPERVQQQLLQVTGNHPGLLKNAAELVGRGQVDAGLELGRLATELLAHEPIQHVCAELWADLETQRNTLRWLALGAPLEQLDAAALEFLRHAGIVETDAKGGGKFFSPLFKAYVQLQSERVAHITLARFNEIRIESWRGARAITVPEADHQLLRAMADAPDLIHTRAALARKLYAAAPEISIGALDAHVKRLRKPLHDALRAVTDDKAIEAILAAPKQGYRLSRHARSGWTIEYHVTS